MLTREMLMAVKTDREYETITLPNPNRDESELVEVRIQRLYADEYISLMTSLFSDDETSTKWRNKHVGELMITRCWVDGDGNRVLDEDDIKKHWWKKQSPAFVTTFITKVREFNKVTVGDGVGEEVKNSEAETDSTA